jgi:hypothetical protein
MYLKTKVSKKIMESGDNYYITHVYKYIYIIPEIQKKI